MQRRRWACPRFGLIDLGVVGPKYLRAIMVFSTREDSHRLDPRAGSFDVHSENVAITVNADLEWSAQRYLTGVAVRSPSIPFRQSGVVSDSKGPADLAPHG